MFNKSIKYVAFYSSNIEESQNRQTALSATNKIDYICRALNRNNYEVQIVSPSWTNNTSSFYQGDNKKIADCISLRTFATFGAKNKMARIIKYLFSLIQLFFYLLISTKKDQPVVVYHSVILFLPIRIAKFFKQFELILEVEEIYQDAQLLPKFFRKSEYKLFEIADKYIFPTELLNDKINKSNKPYAIIYGAYEVEEEQKLKFEYDKIHVVYAGTFDPRKGGAVAATIAAEYLPKNYHIHIIGFGSKKDTKSLMDKIEQVSKISDATLTYDGLLKGKEYIEFLKKCDIGLSTQNPDAEFNDTSFPSKILSYMANGLRVVSVRIKVIEMSAIGNAVYYYEEQTPKAIAKTIIGIDINQHYDSIELIRKLDKEFTHNIKELLER